MSNKDILLDIIGDADPELLPEISLQKRKKHLIAKWTVFGAGICAAAVIVCAVFIPGNGNRPADISPYSGLAQISRDKKSGTEKITSSFEVGAMGFEGLMAYDISELDMSNPWSEDCGITELPVFKNLAYIGRDAGWSELYLTEEQMMQIAENTALSLDTDIARTEIEHLGDHNSGLPDTYLDMCIWVRAECSDLTKVTVYGDGEIDIDFSNKKLPEEYSFTYHNTAADEAENVLEYLSNEYSEVLAFDEPVWYSYAERSYSGNEIRSYYVYDKSGDTVQDILNYNFAYAEFCPDEGGGLSIIRLNNDLCSAEYLGEYPIISAEDARIQLLNGSSYTTVPSEYLKGGSVAEEDIKKCELVYRSYHAEYYQPFYKFYIELDTSIESGSSDGLKNYGIFYVPAVGAEFRVDVGFN